jgi:hypothetical protein
MPPEMRHPLDQEFLEAGIRKEGAATLDAIIEVGVAPKMRHFVEAPVEAAKITDAIAKISDLDGQALGLVQFQKSIEDAGTRPLDAHFDEVVRVREVLDRHERRRPIGALGFAQDQRRGAGAKSLPPRLARKAGAASRPVAQIAIAPNLDQSLLGADLDDIGTGAVAQRLFRDRPTVATIGVEVGVELMWDQRGCVEYGNQVNLLLAQITEPRAASRSSVLRPVGR